MVRFWVGQFRKNANSFLIFFFFLFATVDPQMEAAKTVSEFENKYADEASSTVPCRDGL